MKLSNSNILVNFSVALITVFLFSCASDTEIIEDNTELTTIQAQGSLNELSNTAHTDIVEMINSNGADALIDLFDILATVDDPFNGRIIHNETDQSIYHNRLYVFKEIFIPTQSVNFNTNEDDDRFDFNASKGIYNWDPSVSDFVKADEVVAFIQINFPTEGSATNNASLTLLEYADTAIEGENYSEYYPTVIVGNVTLDDALVVSLNLSASYLLNGDPKSGSVDLFLTPFEYHLSLENSADLNSSVTASISRDSENILSTTVDVDFKSSEKEEPSNIAGEIVYRNHSISGTIDVVSIEEVENSGTGDLNDHIDLVLKEGATLIGSIILVEENTQFENESEYGVYVLYEDGTKELLEDVMSPVIDELEDFLMEIEGEG